MVLSIIFAYNNSVLRLNMDTFNKFSEFSEPTNLQFLNNINNDQKDQIVGTNSSPLKCDQDVKFTQGELKEGLLMIDWLIASERVYNEVVKIQDREFAQELEIKEFIHASESINAYEDDVSFALYLQNEEFAQIELMQQQELRYQQELVKREEQRILDEIKKQQEQDQAKIRHIELLQMIKEEEEKQTKILMNCSICFDEIHCDLSVNDEKRMIITKCCQKPIHSFCAMRCIEINNRCPFCRNTNFM